MTSASSDRRLSISRSLSSSPEPESLVDVHVEPEEIKPPSPFQQKEEEEEPQRLSVTIIEIRNSPAIEIEEQQVVQENHKIQIVQENKENAMPELTEVALVRRRTSCSSTESREEINSRRTSPLYSEPADALPAQIAWKKSQQQGRPLPLPPPFPPSSNTSDFTTFTKDGYVRCTMPSLTQSQSNPRVNVLPPAGQRSTINNRIKQIAMPKPPIPPQTTKTSAIEQRKAFPSVIYLPSPGDDSITIQVNLVFPLNFNLKFIQMTTFFVCVCFSLHTGSIDDLVPVSGLVHAFPVACSSSSVSSSVDSECGHISSDETKSLCL
jgi:hypothetical protein